MKHRRHYTFGKIGLWGGGVALIFGIGFYYFPRDYDLSFLEAFYYTLRLFILEHDLPDFPRSWPLIFIHFFAPLLALSALGTMVTYVFRLSPVIRTRWISDHVIICGVGRTGRLLAEHIKSNGGTVVGVDSGSPDSFDEWCADHNVPLIRGDFLARQILERAGARRARGILFAAGDDLLNLEGVVNAYDWLRADSGPVRLLWAHIANEKLAQTARLALRTEGQVGIRFFDTYHIAAFRMVEKYFDCDVRHGIRQVTVIGFGKFGRDLAEVLMKSRKPDENFTLRVADIRDREKEVRALADELGASDRVSFFQTDVQDLDFSDKKDRAFFLCTDDDIGNLAAALMLTRGIVGTHIYVRMAKWPISAIEGHLRDGNGITFININDLVVEGIEELPGIFRPARAADLKRSSS
ncbi:hypothetical protein DENIS_1560 [Desulfonema ishimotonii]|uniref:RCK N-terminal domain-containing protein n=1 Tax=Desulfonema ishimotonii TaxID=45657 RepID=A0A401FUG6_9BACT|nr:NAD-binding protein [Desulfonema ishimotonii]GBC60603.1 hypothetical protein DENIS_1560 [Desulfonema ishimotonii]